MRPRQMALALDGDGSDEPVPLVYLACRLTSITPDQRKLLDSWWAVDALSWAWEHWDRLDGVGVHLAHRDVTFVCVSQGGIAEARLP